MSLSLNIHIDIHIAKLASQKCSVSAPSVLLHIVASGVNHNKWIESQA